MGSDMPHSYMDMGRESATHLMHKVGGESDRPTHPEELAFHKRDQVHYPDQRFVHNIIMAPHSHKPSPNPNPSPNPSPNCKRHTKRWSG